MAISDVFPGVVAQSMKIDIERRNLYRIVLFMFGVTFG